MRFIRFRDKIHCKEKARQYRFKQILYNQTNVLRHHFKSNYNLQDHLCISVFTTILIYQSKQSEHSLVCHFSLLSWRSITLAPGYLQLIATVSRGFSQTCIFLQTNAFVNSGTTRFTNYCCVAEKK